MEHKLSGQNVRGAMNTVTLRVASLADFLVMKAHAIGGRDKPKDTYDLCYCLEQFPGGMETLAADWNRRLGEKDVARAVEVLRESSPPPMHSAHTRWLSSIIRAAPRSRRCRRAAPMSWFTGSWNGSSRAAARAGAGPPF